MELQDVMASYLLTIKRSTKEFYRLSDKHILPALGAHTEVIGITLADCAKLHRSLASTPYQANRALAVLSAALRHAERLGERPVGSNPCAAVKMFREKKRRRYMKPEEATKIARLLRSNDSFFPKEVLFIRLLMLTGARPDEIRRARWTDIEGSIVRLKIHKTDETGDDRRIYLPPEAVALLASTPRDSDALVGPCNPARLWALIRVEAGCPDLRLYDLRHTFASAALKEGHSLGVIGELLGHRSIATTARYAHLMTDAGVAAAASVGAAVGRMML